MTWRTYRMRTLWLPWILGSFVISSTAQQPAIPAASSAIASPIHQYIHHGWDTLQRSMTDCASVVDSKVTSTATLYLPAGMATPPAVIEMQKHCTVEVIHLPRAIKKMGDVSVAEIPKGGLLYLPNPYVVPGGRFNEMYGWDSYFILLGLLQDGRIDLAKGIVENFFFEIENYGAILNANRTYFLTRSQPPLLSSMIAAIYASTHDEVWLARAYTFAARDHELWTRAPHLAGNTGLARYFDIGQGPVPEMADDSAYYPDVLRWLLSHPDVKTDYLIASHAQPDAKEAESLAQTSCDVRQSTVCAEAYVDGYRLSAAFYRGDRAMRESGFDTSFRFGPFSGSTDEYAPVCLNSLLYEYERDLAEFASILHRSLERAGWQQSAAARKLAIDRYLWQPETGLYFDFNFKSRKRSSYAYLSTFYPLWAGLASRQQAVQVQRHLSLFEHKGGLAMSDQDTGTQWDFPYGWAPTQWFAVDGLASYGFTADADRISNAFISTVDENFVRDGTIREKYNVVSGSSLTGVATGYKANVIGFGWTNGVYVSMQALVQRKRRSLTPIQR